MQGVRQVKIMVSKENFKLVSQLKNKNNVSFTFHLDNQCTSVVVKALHSAENTWEFRGLGLTKLTIFTVVSLKHISSCQAFPWQQEPLGVCCSVPKWHREQLFACALPLHYVSLSWLLRHQYRYKNILTTKVHLVSQSCPVLNKYPLLFSWVPVVWRRECLP